MELIDISPPLSEALAVWPGDLPLRRLVQMDQARGDPVTLSGLEATVHLGAHADAPSHYGKNGATIDAVPLATYLGRCQVMRVAAAPGEAIGPAALPAVLAPRVLIATGTYPDPQRFTPDFAGLAPATIDRLAAESVILIGIDTPSVDPFAAAELPGHAACLKHGVAILEGLVLQNVSPGLYELIALPLRLEGFDASPVRAVLRK